MTTGSCASVALAYIGNKCGYDVGDFRGGESMKFFSRSRNLQEITMSVGGVLDSDVNDFKAAARLLRTIEADKEYYFFCGKHAAMVKKNNNDEYMYLELQSAVSNGWKAEGSKTQIWCAKIAHHLWTKNKSVYWFN